MKPIPNTYKQRVSPATTLILLLGLTSFSVFATDSAKGIPVEVVNKRGQAVHVRDSLVRHPVYCLASAYVYGENYPMKCYKSKTRERVEIIPQGYRLAITDLSAEASPLLNGDDEGIISLGVGKLGVGSIVSPSVVMRGALADGDEKHYTTPYLVMSADDEFGVRSFSSHVTYVFASGYLIKASDLKRISH